MANITYRVNSNPAIPGTSIVKGTPLTNVEVDANFRAIDIEVDQLNSSTVRLTGDQTIAGVKTFSSQIVASGGVQGDVTGNVTGNAGTVTNGVYTTGAQTLTNKTIAFGSNTLTDVASTNTAQTLTNKTLTSPAITGGTASGLTLNDGYTEEIFAVTGTTPALSPTNGSIQTWTLTGNSTPTVGTWAAGQSMTLMVNDGTAFTITWTSLGVVWAGGTAPTLATTGFTVLHLWRVGSTTYGIRAGEVA